MANIEKEGVLTRLNEDGDLEELYPRVKTDASLNESGKAADAMAVGDTLGYENVNLLPYPYYDTTMESHGITWTDNGDGTITANGKTTASSLFRAAVNLTLPPGEYIFSSGNSDIKGYIVSIDEEVTEFFSGPDIGSEAKITLDGRGINVLFMLASTTVSNLTVKPMIRRPHHADRSEWVPYVGSVDDRIDAVDAKFGGYLPLTGGTLSDDLHVITSDQAQIYVECTGTNGKRGVFVAKPNAFGLYSSTDGKWLVSCGADGSVVLNGNANTATRLAATREVKVNLSSNVASSFDGSSACYPGVYGTLPVGYGGTGATTAANARTNLGLAAAATRGVTTASSLAHTNHGTNGNYVPDMNFLSYWNGAYNSSGNSNLTYCVKGAFGTSVTYGATSSVTSGSGSLVTSGAVYNAVAGRIPYSGGTLTGALNLANNTWNTVGDDAYFGDKNVAECIAIKGKGGTGSGIALFAASEGDYCRVLTNNTAADLYLCANRSVYISNGTNSARAPIYASAFNNASSARVKENVSTVSEEEAMKLLELRPVNYDYIGEDAPKGCTGLIAEEVAQILPNCVNGDVNCADDDEEAIKGIGIDYSKFVPYLIKLAQVQEERIKELESKLQ